MMLDVFAEIIAERDRQISLGYTADHDHGHGTAYWVALVSIQLAQAVLAVSNDPAPMRNVRTRLVRAAALLVAALQAYR